MSDIVETTKDKEGNVLATKTTTSPDKTDEAFIFDTSKNAWVKPPKPSGKDIVWVPNVGWSNKEQQASAWGYNLALIESDEGLNSVFKQAWNDELRGASWTKEKFIAEIRNKPWYKSRSEAQRLYDAQVAKGPNSPDWKEVQSKIDKALAGVRSSAQQQGLQFNNTELKKIATDVVRNGYNDIELNGIFAKLIKNRTGGIKEFFDNISGTTGVGADKTTILQWAKDNGVSVSDTWVSQQVQEILSGNHDVQKSKDYITSLAKIAYPAHADYIDSKTSVMDRAQTYAQKISSLLEVPFEQIDLTNKHLTDALKPGEDGKPKNLTQVEQELRSTSDWAKTNNAKETANSIVNSILNKFGLM